jgi:CysZ protein
MSSSPLAPRQASRPGFADGLGALFSGFGFVITTPAVWPLAIVPAAVALGVTALLGGAAVHVISPVIRDHLGTTSVLLTQAAEVVAGVIAVAAAAAVGFSLAQPLSGPALSRIVRRAEIAAGGQAWPATGVVTDVGRAFESLAVSYGFGLPLLAALWTVTFLFPPASVVTFPLKLLVLALLAAWDLCDYPLSVRDRPVRERVAFLRRNLGAMVGFGAGIALVSLVPCVLVLILPAGVAGAARLTRKIEVFEKSGGSDPRERRGESRG